MIAVITYQPETILSCQLALIMLLLLLSLSLLVWFIFMFIIIASFAADVPHTE